MRKIHCADCGKNYDYDVDDFCPRCGSFNPPPDGGATRLEQELLSRFQQPGSGIRGPGKQARAVSYHPTYGSGPDLKPGRTHTGRIQSCAACEPKQKKKNGGLKVMVLVVVVLVLLFALSPLVELGIRQAITAFDGLSDAFGSREEGHAAPAEVLVDEEPVPAEELLGNWYEDYDTFTLSNGQQVSVGGRWQPWLPDWYLEQFPADTRCLAVDLWVLGEPGDDYVPTLLVTEDGASYLPEELPLQVTEECGLESVSLADGMANEELYGHLFYFLPEQEAEGELSVLIMDTESIWVSLTAE
ncbi:hypothetical protein [uncultured Flavonifractor sp.]|uniref:hypothetical protein n=1 Tax=uncultured Flavonifractor sp. TaxID=1193534 RepID=UPI0026216DDF|nr:hypothetical protein [uncultured Flavonifractor sp.]